MISVQKLRRRTALVAPARELRPGERVEKRSTTMIRKLQTGEFRCIPEKRIPKQVDAAI
jgi:hypothetical protein